MKSATGGSGNSHSTSSGFLSHKIGQKLLLVVLEIEPEAGRLVSAAEPGEGEGDFVARDPGDDTPLLLIQINDQRVSECELESMNTRTCLFSFLAKFLNLLN